MKVEFLAIEGCIGSGKTTLANMLSEAFNARLLSERFAENPFLEKFYENKEQFGFATEMSFLADRYQQINEFFKPDLFKPKVISDYASFKSLLFAKQNLSEAEFILYRQFYELSLGKLNQPQLILHLNRPTDVLFTLIEKRGREYEKTITEDYLVGLKNAYNSYYNSRPKQNVIFLELGDVDFVHSKKHYLNIKNLIETYDYKEARKKNHLDVNKI